MPESISVTDLHRHTSRYVERAAAGETFIITRRGEPVAWMVPLPDAPPYDQEALEAFGAEYRRIQGT